MPRRCQIGSGGIVFHVLNRAARRARLFFEAEDYAMFLRAMIEAARHVPMRVLAFAVMPNHFHLVLWPIHDTDLSSYMQRLTRVHAQWWHQAHHSVGTGAVYQGRFKAIPVQTDLHFLTVCAYVERNPLRARLVTCAQQWQWGSAWEGLNGQRPVLSPWPVTPPPDWRDWVDRKEREAEVETLRGRIQRSVPFGSADWASDVATRLRLDGKARGRGRPRQRDVAESEIRPGRNYDGSSGITSQSTRYTSVPGKAADRIDTIT